MDLQQARALALIDERHPEYVQRALCESGYGPLAEQWRRASQAFADVSGSELPAASVEPLEQPVNTQVVRAYARMCMSWAPIGQLRDQALAWIEQREAHARAVPSTSGQRPGERTDPAMSLSMRSRSSSSNGLVNARTLGPSDAMVPPVS